MNKLVWITIAVLGTGAALAAPTLLTVFLAPDLPSGEPPSADGLGQTSHASRTPSGTLTPTSPTSPPAPPPPEVVEDQGPTTLASPKPTCPPDCVATPLAGGCSPCPVAQAPILTVVPGGSGIIQSCWTTVPNAAQYELYRSATDGFAPTIPIQTTSAADCYLDAGLVPGATYYYRVVGLDAFSVQGPMSPQAAQTAGVDGSTLAPVPELSTLVLVLGGVVALALTRRK